MSRLDELERLLAESHPSTYPMRAGGVEVHNALGGSVAECSTPARAMLLAAAVNALPALIRVARAAKERVESRDCNDTCTSLLIEGEPCTCGHVELKAALDALEAGR